MYLSLRLRVRTLHDLAHDVPAEDKAQVFPTRLAVKGAVANIRRTNTAWPCGWLGGAPCRCSCAASRARAGQSSPRLDHGARLARCLELGAGCPPTVCCRSQLSMMTPGGPFTNSTSLPTAAARPCCRRYRYSAMIWVRIIESVAILEAVPGNADARIFSITRRTTGECGARRA